MNKKVLADPAALIAQAIDDFGKLLSRLREQQPEVTVLLTGGTLGIEFASALGRSSIDLQGVTFIFGDERYVAVDHPDRNEQQALDVFPELEANLVRYPQPSRHLSQGAELFNIRISELLGPLEKPRKQIDLTILGMGPDGHVASLFPGKLHGKGWIVSEKNSPKPPSQRLSFSYEALSSSERVWFLVSGSAKADSLRKVFAGELPAAKGQGVGETTWYLDSEVSDAL
jgi:6-phosphogluconolactonase